MKYLLYNNGNITINNDVFKYTNKIRLEINDKSSYDLNNNTLKKFKYDFNNNDIIKLYLYINNEWFYYEKIIIKFESITIPESIINDILIKHEERIKEKDKLIKNLKEK